jgi:hypothetical protein
MGDFNQVVTSGTVINPLITGETKKRGGLDFRVYQEMKTGIHRDLINKIDLEKVATQRDDRTRRQVFAVIQELVSNLKTPLSGPEKERLSLEVLDEVFGLGPLEPLLQDPTISGERRERRVRGTCRCPGRNANCIQRQRSPDAHYRQNRLGRRAACR